ncbi:hypothetical protein SNEBB_000636, partial [Seison nebaliae]
MDQNGYNDEINEFDRTEEEIDDEMQRELADDAPWKRIQQNTFTRWANEHLKIINRQINDLQWDLSNGLNLIALIELLSHKKLPRHNKKPSFRSQKMENVAIALDFLEHSEGVTLINIDATDIVDGRLKLILGLIWTLILHYSISLPIWEGLEEEEDRQSPKQKLLQWVQGKLPPDLPIRNFTTDWNDGQAIGALVDSCAPGLYPDWRLNKKTEPLNNARDAMDLAEQWLGVPQLIRPEEMVDPKVDQESMMTYLSQYPSAKPLASAPLSPRTDAKRVRCYGKGIEPIGNHVNEPAKFTIDVTQAGKGQPEVIVLNPRGVREPIDIVYNDDSKTYSCTYIPTMEGMYRVIVKYGGEEVPKSPYNVKVEGEVGDSSRVRAFGPGLEAHGSVVVDKPTYFDIDTTDAGNGHVDVAILSPKNNGETVPCQIRQTSPGIYRCEYVAKEPGLHSVNVFFASQPIPLSPYGVNVAPSYDARKVKVYGRGIQPHGVRVGDIADFKVVTKDAGDGNLKVSVTGPDGEDVECRVSRISVDTYECGYNPKKPGVYTVNVMYGGSQTPRSPYTVNVGPFKQSSIRAFGPGLEGGVVGYPANFVVETNMETGSLGFSIEGPSQAKIDCQDNMDGSADVSYLPTAPGEYAVHILCDDEDIPGSPYMAWIEPKPLQSSGRFDPSRIRCYGPGIEPNTPIVTQPAQFTVDTRDAGDAPLSVTCLDNEYNPVDVNVRNMGDGTYQCRYIPVTTGRHTIMVTYGGVSVPKSPFRVNPNELSNPSRVRVYGPGVEKGVKTHQPTNFTVDCRDAGPGDVSIALTDNQGRDLMFNIDDSKDGRFLITYTPQVPGMHKITVLFNDKPIPISPLHVDVEPSIDVSRVKVTGLDSTPAVGQPTEFNLITAPAGDIKEEDVSVLITMPSGATQNALITPITDGYNVKFNVQEHGPYTIQPYINGIELGAEPIVVNSVDRLSADQVKVHGTGLSQGIVNKPNHFFIDRKHPLRDGSDGEEDGNGKKKKSDGIMTDIGTYASDKDQNKYVIDKDGNMFPIIPSTDDLDVNEMDKGFAIPVGKNRYKKDDKGNFVKDVDGDYVMDDNNIPILIDDEDHRVMEVEKERFSKDEEGHFIPDKMGEYIKDNSGDFIPVGRRRYRLDEDNNQLVPDEAGDYIITDTDDIVNLKEAERFAIDEHGRMYPNDDGNYIKDKDGNFMNIGQPRYQLDDDDKFVPSSTGDYVKDDHGRYVPVSGDKFLIKKEPGVKSDEKNKNFIPTDQRRYRKEKDGTFVPDRDGDFIPSTDGKFIEAGRRRYASDGQGNFISDEKGNYIKDDTGKMIPIDRQKYEKLDDGTFRENDQGNFIKDDDDNFVNVGVPRYTLDKEKGFIPDDNGEYILDTILPLSNHLVHCNDKRKYEKDKNGRYYPNDKGRYIGDDNGNVYNVNKPRYQKTVDGNFIPKSDGNYISDDKGDFVCVGVPRFSPERKRPKVSNDYILKVVGDTILDNDGIPINIDDKQRYRIDDDGIMREDDKGEYINDGKGN